VRTTPGLEYILRVGNEPEGVASDIFLYRVSTSESEYRA
jgi:hypothetical protein